MAATNKHVSFNNIILMYYTLKGDFEEIGTYCAKINPIMAESEQAKIVVRVQPNAKQNQLVGFKEGVLHIRITAPPVDGKANDALIKFLSGCLGVSKSRLSIEKGMTGRIKTIAIRGLSQRQALSDLERLSG